METIRLVLLGVFFAGLLGLWVWSRRQARLRGPAKSAAAGFKVAHKRWLDQKTGVAMVEAEGQSFLLAYTVGGGVSWQPLARKPVAETELADASPDDFERLLSEAEPVLMRFR